MNQPAVPPNMSVPPPPPMPGAAAPAAGPDLEAEIRSLIPGRVNIDGHTVQPTPEWQGHVDWAFATLKAKMGDDLEHIAMFLRGASSVPLTSVDHGNPVEEEQPAAGQQTLLPGTEQHQPPANPISDQTGAQQATLPEAPTNDQRPDKPGEDQGEEAPTDPEKLAGWDRISGRQMKNLTGLKRRLTATHKIDWQDYCTRFGLNTKTGLPEDQGAPEQPPTGLDAQPNRPPPAAPGLPTQQSQDGTLQAQLPPTPGQSQPAAATPPPASTQQPEPPPAQPEPPPTQPEPQQTERPGAPLPSAVPAGGGAHLDYMSTALQMIPQTVQWDNGRLVAENEAAWMADWLRGAFNGNCQGVTDQNYPWALYSWLGHLMTNGLHYVAPVAAPEDQTSPTAPAAEAPADTPAPDVPTFTSAPPATATAAPQQPDPLVGMAANLIQAAAGGGLGPEAQQMANEASGAVSQQPTGRETVSQGRHDMAQALGGAVDLFVLPLLETSSVDLGERIDANQMVTLAESQALQQVTDPQALKFREDRKVAQRLFADMLTKTPQVYVLTNGFNWLLDDHYVNILMARVVSGTVWRQGKPYAFKL